MRNNSETFDRYNQNPQRELRLVVVIEFPTPVYLASHGDISGLPAGALGGVLQKVSSTSQRLIPEAGRAEIGAISFELVDVGGVFTDTLRNQLQAGNGIKGRTVRLFQGGAGMDWSDFRLEQTQVAEESLGYDHGRYRVRCRDIQREMRKDIFVPRSTRLAADFLKGASTLSVYSTADFEPCAHPASFGDAPGQTVYYLKIKYQNGWEVVRATGKTGTTFTGVTRALFGTVEYDHTVPTENDSDKGIEVEEYIYLELPAPAFAYALLTGNILGTANTLPSNWHLGIDPAQVVADEFENIGADWFDPNDYSKGVILRFDGLSKTDGKRFIEQEINLLLGAYMPVNAAGQLGYRRMAGVLASAGTVGTLTASDVVSLGELQQDLAALRNIFSVQWAWYEAPGFDGRFLRANVLADAASIATHGEAKPQALKFRGLHNSRHTFTTLKNRFDALRDRFAGPPLRLRLSLLPSNNDIEVGDVVRVALPQVRDYTRLDNGVERLFLTPTAPAFQSMALLSPRVVMGDLNGISFMMAEDGTVIYRNGEVLRSGDAGKIGVIAAGELSAGDVLESNGKPVALVNAYGYQLPALCGAGTAFGFVVRDGQNSVSATVEVFSPYDDATVTVFDSSGDPITISETGSDTATVSRGEIASLTLLRSVQAQNNIGITSSRPVLIFAKKSNGGDNITVLPASSEMLLPRGTASGLVPITAASIDSAFASQGYYTADGLFGAGAVGDAAGADGEAAIPADGLGDVYLLPHDVKGYRILAIEPTVVTVTDATGAVYDTHDLSAASPGSPLAHAEGSISGSVSDPVLIPNGATLTGTGRFALRTNIGEDEYTCWGYRSALREPYNRVRRGEFGRLDRAMEVQRISVDQTSGSVQVELFGSTQAASAITDEDADTSAELPDGWYSAAGTEMTAAGLSIDGSGFLTADGTLAGSDSSRTIYYYLGDLTIPAGRTLTVSDNVQLNVMGVLQVDGTLRGAPSNGAAGWLGSCRGGGGRVVGNSYGSNWLNLKGEIVKGRNEVMPALTIDNDGGNLLGIPADLRGSGGAAGGDSYYYLRGDDSYELAGVGGAGGQGGAGLAVVARGIAFGVAGKIDTSGGDGSPGNDDGPIYSVPAGSGGGGAPGGVLLIVDGHQNPQPVLTGSKLVACYGDSPSSPGNAGSGGQCLGTAAARVYTVPKSRSPYPNYLADPEIDPQIKQAIDAADQAAQAASDAQADASTALAKLDDIGADGKLHPSEKLRAVLEYNQLTGEQAGIEAVATSFGITTEKTAYTSAVGALTSYLGGLTPNWDDTSATTSISRTLWNSNWQAVFDARQALLDKVAEVAAQRADWAQVNGVGKPADNADVTADNTGGRGVNLVPAKYAGIGVHMGGTIDDHFGVTNNRGTAVIDKVTSYQGGASLKLFATSADHYAWFGPTESSYNIPLEAGRSYIVSGYARCSQASRSGNLIVKTNDAAATAHIAGFTTSNTTNVWERFSFVFTAPAGTTRGILRADCNDDGATMWFDALMVEEQVGNVSTPSAWSLPGPSSPEDIDYTGDLDATRGADGSNLLVGVGSNQLENSSFRMGTEGWVYSQSGSMTDNVLRGIRGQSQNWGWAPGTIYIRQEGSIDAWARWYPVERVPVLAGQYYEFSAYISAHRADCAVLATWYDSAGAQISSFFGNTISGTGDSSSPSENQRSVYIGQAPAGAESVRFGLHKEGTNAGETDSWLFAARCFVGRAHPGQVEPSAWAEGYAGTTRVLGTIDEENRIIDQRNIPMVMSEVAAVNTGSVLTASDVGSTCTIAIAAHTVQFGGYTVNYNSGSLTGWGFNKKVFVYCDDEGFDGGAVVYGGSQILSTTKANRNRRLVGIITTPSDGGGSISDPNPEECVASGQWLLDGLQVDDAQAGDQIDVWDIGDADCSTGVIDAIKPAHGVQCVRLVMESGAQVVCSVSTPVTGPDGEVRKAPAALGMQLGVLHHNDPLRWERVVAVTPAGLRTVYRLSCGNISFAAGVEPDHRVVTHNIYYKP